MSEFKGFLSSCETYALTNVWNFFSAWISLYKILSDRSLTYKINLSSY